MRERNDHGVRVAQIEAETHPVELDGHADEDIQLVRETVPARVSRGESTNNEERHRSAAAWPWGSAVRIAFGAIWLVNAYFKWQPSFLNGLLDVMHDGRVGQPGWLMPWFNLTRAIIALQPELWAHVIAIVETGIALALLFGVARKLTYVGGALWSLAIWATAEGFGRTGPGTIATDAGTAIAYAAVFLALLAADQRWVTRRYSLDAVIERRLPLWTRIAEVRRQPNAYAATESLNGNQTHLSRQSR